MRHVGTQTLETPRLILRRFTMDDAQAMYENWASDGKVTKYLTWPPHLSVDVTKVVLSSWISRYEEPDYYSWAIELREGPGPIGSISVVRSDEDVGSLHVGYCIGQQYWGKGIMTEAFSAVIGFLFETVGANRIEARHDPRNPASGRVMQKCGMTFEGTLRCADRNNQGVCDASYYSILKDEWDVRKEIETFIRYPYEFDGFMDFTALTDGVLSLVCVQKKSADPVKKYVPAYSFEVRKDGVRVGEINLRIGYPEGLYYGGNIGYAIDEPYRGNGYAVRACRLLIPVAKAHGMQILYISNDRDNHASRRVCEKLGAMLLRVAKLPEDTELYQEGHRYENIFVWDISEA